MATAMDVSRRRLVAKRSVANALKRARRPMPSPYKMRLPSGQLKRLDIGFTSSTIGTTSQLSHLTGITAGADIGQRSGNKVFIKSLAVRGFISGNPAATTEQFYRLVFFYDKGNQGATPAGSDYFTTDGPREFMNQYNTERFVTIRSYFVKSYTNSDIGTPIEFYHRFKKPIQVNYGGTGSSVTNVRANAFFILVVGSDATNVGACGFAMRLTYFDQ